MSDQVLADLSNINREEIAICEPYDFEIRQRLLRGSVMDELTTLLHKSS